MLLALQPASANEMVHRRGNTIVDGIDTQLRLISVNIGGWLMWEGWIFGKGLFLTESKILSGIQKLSGMRNDFQSAVYDQYVSDADFELISKLGFNAVRVPFNHRLIEDDATPYKYKEDGFRRLDAILDSCERHGLYVILDMHAVPGGQSRTMVADPDSKNEIVWNSITNQTRTVELWKAIATRYRDRKVIAGYDLINEPLLNDGGNLISLYKRIITAIRAVDQKHMIILEGGKMASDFSMFSGPLDENQIYSFHIYTWFGDNRVKKLGAYEAISQAQQVPFWCGEFGENNYGMLESTVTMFERAPWITGWSFWTWKRAPSRFPGLVVFDVPPEFKRILDWIIWPARVKPPRATVDNGIAQFLQAVQLRNCHLNQQMAQIVVGRGTK